MFDSGSFEAETARRRVSFSTSPHPVKSGDRELAHVSVTPEGSGWRRSRDGRELSTPQKHSSTESKRVQPHALIVS